MLRRHCLSTLTSILSVVNSVDIVASNLKDMVPASVIVQYFRSSILPLVVGCSVMLNEIRPARYRIDNPHYRRSPRRLHRTSISSGVDASSIVLSSPMRLIQSSSPPSPPSSVPSLLHDPPKPQKGRTSQPATTVRPRSMTATTARQALICCFATLMIADQSKTHDISGNLPMPHTGVCYRPSYSEGAMFLTDVFWLFVPKLCRKWCLESSDSHLCTAHRHCALHLQLVRKQALTVEFCTTGTV